jgi:uncharacterized protein (DUF2141 family)
MKTIFLTIAISLTTLLVTAQSDSEIISEGTTITVTVPVKSNQGKVHYGLYNENTFMKGAPLQGLEGEIVDGKAIVTFTNITPGMYAITLFHDTNGNNQMDFEPNGMPKEMYGVSNNPMSFGPPQWNEAKFEVANVPVELEIRL